jgi:lipopolysaccharide biosynthesis protein
LSKVRTIAIHLPQFHPIPENNEWWGKGFTEWTNVAKAKPLFAGHYQPHLPADLGFYDLRLAESRQEQADLAAAYGIYGFCYYHYWFEGKRLLNAPVDAILESGKPDFPFMLCWANGSWTRTWDGNDNILMEQKHSLEDDRAHIQHLIKYFKDKRYIRIGNKPVFAICRTELLPFPDETAALWRTEIRKAGFEDIYLIKMEMFETGKPAEKIGFDACAEFQPDWRNLPVKLDPGFSKLKSLFSSHPDPFKKNNIYQYREVVEKMLAKPKAAYKCYPCVTPGWDNSPRKKENALIMIDSRPEYFGNWVQKVLDGFEPYSGDENFLFINAWNEWAEGNHLEPCQKWGRAYLEAFKSALT